jgi:hypothetical protein
MTGAVSFGLNGFSWVANGASWVGSLFSSKKKSGKSPKRPFDDFSTPGRPTGCGHRLQPPAVAIGCNHRLWPSAVGPFFRPMGTPPLFACLPS